MQKIIFIIDFIDNDVSDELKRRFIINVSIHSHEISNMHLLHLKYSIFQRKETSKFGINTLTYDDAKIWNQFYFEFVINELSLTKVKLKILLKNHSLKVVSATFGPIKMFEKQSLSFHVVSKTFITQNYLFVIPSNILRFSCLYHSFLAHFKPRDNRGKHDFEKQCYCGNYSDDVYQCLNTDQILLKIQYFDHNTL